MKKSNTLSQYKNLNIFISYHQLESELFKLGRNNGKTIFLDRIIQDIEIQSKFKCPEKSDN